jgi:hypothetical protein
MILTAHPSNEMPELPVDLRATAALARLPAPTDPKSHAGANESTGIAMNTGYPQPIRNHH